MTKERLKPGLGFTKRLCSNLRLFLQQHNSYKVTLKVLCCKNEGNNKQGSFKRSNVSVTIKEYLCIFELSEHLQKDFFSPIRIYLMWNCVSVQLWIGYNPLCYNPFHYLISVFGV